jgi:hypothetical protein
MKGYFQRTDEECVKIVNILIDELSDNVFPHSKDWKSGDIVERVQYLKLSLKHKTEELDHFIDLANEKHTKENIQYDI